MILTEHKIILGNSERMPELADQSVQLMVTSPPYPMIKMWDVLYRTDHNIDILWKKLENEANKETKEKLIASIYDSMHRNLCRVWQEVYRVLIPGGIACINIGDATRTINKKFRLFPNHSRILEVCEEIGFTILPYVLWKKTTTKPKYKGKCQFLHGHTWTSIFYITGKVQKDGMVIDFKRIKEVIDTFLPDHQYLNDICDNPTAESIAEYLYNKLSYLLNKMRLRLDTVEVWESENCGVVYAKD